MDEAIAFLIETAKRAGCDCEVEVELNEDEEWCPLCQRDTAHARIRHDPSCTYLKRRQRIAAAHLN